MGKPVRFRGLRFPADPAVLPDRLAAALAEGKLQQTFTDAALALARTDDVVSIWGAGAGHIAALLAGKLGLPNVTVYEGDAARRAYLMALAETNGLPRLCVAPAEASVFATSGATLVIADLSQAPELPLLADLQQLRAAAILLAPQMEPARVSSLFGDLAARGLIYAPAHSSGTTLAFVRPFA